MKKTEKDTKQTRKAILEASMSVFTRKGYAATRLDEVAKEAGFSRGPIYWHYKNKAELFGALVHYSIDRIEAVINKTLSQSGDVKTKIFKSLYRIVTEEQKALEILQQLDSVHEDDRVSAEMLQNIQNRVLQIKLLLDELIEEGKKKNQVRVNVSPEDFSMVFFIFIKGLLLSKNGVFDSVFNNNRKIEDIIEIIFEGFDVFK